MNRTNKLYERLDNIEQEYLALLLDEFKDIAQGYGSTYITRKTSSICDGKFWEDEEVSNIEGMEREIKVLREKLGESMDSSPISLVQEYVQSVESLTDEFSGGKTHLAKEMIKKMEKS